MDIFIISILCSLLCPVGISGETNIRFQRAGKLYTTKNFIHVSIHFDVSTLVYNCERFLNATELLQYSYPNNQRRLSHLKTTLKKECASLPHQTPQKVKRQAALTALAIGAVTGFFSNQWLHRYHHHYDNQEGIIMLRVQQLQQHQEEEMQQLSRQVTEHLQTLQDEAQISSLERGVDVFVRRIRRFHTVAEALYEQKLPRAIFDDDSLEQCWTLVSQRAYEAGGSMPFSNADQLLQLPVSIVEVNPGYISAVLHVPVIDQVLTLLYLEHAYIFPEKGLATTGNNSGGFLSIRAEKNMLAYQPKGQFYTETTADELSACLRLGHGHYFCPLTTLKKDLKESCLGSVYLGHLAAVKQRCQIQHRDQEWTIFSSGADTVIIFSQRSVAYSVICVNQTTTGLTEGGQASSVLLTDSSCHVDADEFRFYPPAPPMKILWEEREHEWHMQTVLNPIQIQDISNYRASNNLPVQTIDLSEVMHYRKTMNTPTISIHSLVLYILITATLTCTTTLFLFLYYQFHRITVNNPVC
jgi:hypothetical protein